MRFSQRTGRKPTRVEIQRESIDDVLRTKLWSAVHYALDNGELLQAHIDPDYLAHRLWLDFFHLPVDETPRFTTGSFEAKVREWFFKAQWYEIYDFLEALLGELKGWPKTVLTDYANAGLQSELSAYRIIDDRVVEITTTEEIDSINEALARTD